MSWFRSFSCLGLKCLVTRTYTFIFSWGHAYGREKKCFVYRRSIIVILPQELWVSPPRDRKIPWSQKHTCHIVISHYMSVCSFSNESVDILLIRLLFTCIPHQLLRLLIQLLSWVTSVWPTLLWRIPRLWLEDVDLLLNFLSLGVSKQRLHKGLPSLRVWYDKDVTRQFLISKSHHLNVVNNYGQNLDIIFWKVDRTCAYSFFFTPQKWLKTTDIFFTEKVTTWVWLVMPRSN